MSREKPTGPVCRLNVEALEDRTVPASFGPNRGMSVEFANVIPDNINPGNEFITGTGPGRTALVRVWSANGTLRASFLPFGGFQGGVFVKAGNVDDDNQMELIVSTAAGTVGRVKVYELGLSAFQPIAAFIPYGPNYTGGVEAALGNVTGDRPQEIIVGQQSFGSLVRVFADINPTSPPQFVAIRSFLPFGTNYFGGVSVAAANVDSFNIPLADPSDFAEVIVGKASREPRIKIFDVQQATVVQRGAYLAFDTTFPGNRNGVNLAAGNTDGQRGAEIFVAIKGSSRVRVFSGPTGLLLTEVFPFVATSRMTNLTVNQNDDDFFDIYGVADLIVVRADGPYEQVPLIYPGRLNSPAGLNGSRPAP
jgi:hypothetical protein